MFDETKVLAALAAGDVLYAETFEEETASTLIQLESEKVEKLEKGVDSGVGLRAIRPWQTFFASTNSREEGHLVDLAKELVRTLPARARRAGQGRQTFNWRATRFSSWSRPAMWRCRRSLVSSAPSRARPGRWRRGSGR